VTTPRGCARRVGRLCACGREVVKAGARPPPHQPIAGQTFQPPLLLRATCAGQGRLGAGKTLRTDARGAGPSCSTPRGSSRSSSGSIGRRRGVGGTRSTTVPAGTTTSSTRRPGPSSSRPAPPSASSGPGCSPRGGGACSLGCKDLGRGGAAAQDRAPPASRGLVPAGRGGLAGARIAMRPLPRAARLPRANSSTHLPPARNYVNAFLCEACRDIPRSPFPNR